MKHSWLVALTYGVVTTALAQDVGRVVSSTPVVQQVLVPQQVCQEVPGDGGNAGAGAVMGAIAGGVIGNSVGQGSGRAAATMIGLLGGAVLGGQVAGRNAQTQMQCHTQERMESRVTGYNVVYEYAGKQYSVVLPQEPGPTIAVQVSPAASAYPPASAQPLSGAADGGTVMHIQSQGMAYAPPPTTITYGNAYYPYVITPPPLVIRDGYRHGHRRHHDHPGHWR